MKLQLMSASEPAFSPDGPMVVFSRGEGAVSDTTGSEFMSVFAVDTDGMDERRLSREMYDLSPAWSPNGQRVAFVRRSQGTRGVVVVDLASGAAETVAAGVGWRQVIWRSDDEVVVTDWRSGGGMDPDLVAVTVSTGETRKVGTAPSADTVWNAERTKVASSRYGDPAEVVVLDVATGEIAAVPGSASRGAEPFVWTPDGDLLFSQNVRGPKCERGALPRRDRCPDRGVTGFPRNREPADRRQPGLRRAGLTTNKREPAMCSSPIPDRASAFTSGVRLPPVPAVRGG